MGRRGCGSAVVSLFDFEPVAPVYPRLKKGDVLRIRDVDGAETVHLVTDATETDDYGSQTVTTLGDPAN